MKKHFGIGVILISFLLIEACGRKTTPANSENAAVSNIEVIPEKKKPAAPIKTPTPKVIAVNDNAATKSVDGRYYYDLEGKRYWRNKKDGKYYLYYKGMFEKPEFQ